MSATIRRRSRSCLLFGAFLFLTVTCFAFVFEQHWRERDDTGLAPRRLARAWQGPAVSPHSLNASGSPVIDPVLAYSTYLGGSNFANIPTPNQAAYASFVDSQGNVYITGSTNSPNFPVTPGVLQTTNPSQAYISFVSKISPDGKSLVFSTYVNLTKQYVNSALAVDSSGNIFVAGTNPSFTIPAGTTPFQATPKTADSILIVKLNSSATKVLNATYLSGSGSDRLWGLAVDADGNLYATGATNSSDFPTKNPLQAAPTSTGGGAFVTKLDSSLSNLLYSTYLGGDSSATATSIAVDNAKNAYVVGDAGLGFPTTLGAAQTTCHLGCGFLAKLDSSGSSLLYATYIGGSAPMSVAVDQSQNTFIAGVLNIIDDFPQIKPLQSCIESGGFVSEISATGALAFSTCLGTNGLTSVAVDGSGVAYVTGSADDTLPLKNPIQQNANPAPYSTCYVSAIDTTAGSLLFSSFLAGGCASVGTDSTGNIYVAGGGSQGFPVLNPLQASPSPKLAGCLPTLTCAVTDAVIMKISPTDGAAAALSPAAIAFTPQVVGTSSPPQAVAVIDMGSAPLTVSNVTVTGDFSVSSDCGVVSPAGGTCTIQVTFDPQVPDLRSGTVTVTNSGSASQTIALMGTGLATASLGLGIATGSSSSATVAAGASASYILTIGGEAVEGTASLSCAGLPRGVSCSLPPTIPVSGTVASTFSVNVTTTSRSQGIFGLNRFWPMAWMWLFGLAGLFFVRRAASRETAGPVRLVPLLTIVLCACGGGSSTGPPTLSGTQAGNYTLTVTATSGASTEAQNLTLIVQ